MSDISFMIDIETTGVDTMSCNLLQIALLPIKFIDGFFQPYKVAIPSFKTRNFEMSPDGFVFTQMYSGSVSDFGMKYQTKLYDRCRDLPRSEARNVRKEIIDYTKMVSAVAPFNIVGKNIGVFDLPILSRLGYLYRDDYHYRIEDMSGCFKLAQRVTGKTKEELEKLSLDLNPIKFDIPGTDHEALSDCYRQTAVYNGLIAFLRKE